LDTSGVLLLHAIKSPQKVWLYLYLILLIDLWQGGGGLRCPSKIDINNGIMKDHEYASANCFKGILL